MGYADSYRRGKYFSYTVKILESWEQNGITFYRIKLKDQTAVVKQGTYFSVEEGDAGIIEEKPHFLGEVRELNKAHAES